MKTCLSDYRKNESYFHIEFGIQLHLTSKIKILQFLTFLHQIELGIPSNQDLLFAIQHSLSYQ